ncbi:hypothetical protein FHG66_09115 [Rubellimicrobium rubrum]|uniref:LamG domain-containing protein n=1 Tax=Rubellimicrobium rubrum TaxID=2585369 RepID=A0A5C4MZS7_9RHOB|nr:heparin lyase I family protein [Rubellimicrobium rubrum]TNC50111.1 hypothetical protein FHG66_09115 [Rubellimicrobium rubrum]
MTGRGLLLAGGLMLAANLGHAQGLDFQSAAVAENFAGLTPAHSQEASLRPGRIAVDTDPNRIRLGATSIRMQLVPGDCGARIGGGLPDDCAEGNERIEINDTTPLAGTTLQAFSLMLGGDFGQASSGSAPTLVQWFQQNAGPCFSIQYSIADRRMFLRNRCPQGSYGVGEPQDTTLRVSPFDQFNEFVVLANWSKGADGLFRVLLNNQLVYSYTGPTLAAEGADQVNQRFMILRPNGLGQIPTTSTMWIDDAIRGASLEEIEQRYAFDRANLGVR